MCFDVPKQAETATVRRSGTRSEGTFKRQHGRGRGGRSLFTEAEEQARCNYEL
jgi:hypothetical protein